MQCKRLYSRVLVACPKTGAPRPDCTTLITDHFSNNNHTDLILPHLEITSESFWGYSLFHRWHSGFKIGISFTDITKPFKNKSVVLPFWLKYAESIKNGRSLKMILDRRTNLRSYLVTYARKSFFCFYIFWWSKNFRAQLCLHFNSEAGQLTRAGRPARPSGTGRGRTLTQKRTSIGISMAACGKTLYF